VKARSRSSQKGAEYENKGGIARESSEKGGGQGGEHEAAAAESGMHGGADSKK
jgi:hypothetical protein